ncbi:hypothetical protein [Deinococcus fonticola]|uniref:hypothetical protein n=1 Tax=Deinococcus fonticola TaxID=2528713 RepID=UPI001075547B|nr:hypothetical protein [Deinococcus fonticola]
MTTTETQKGKRGFELNIHVAFAQGLPREQALATLLALEGFRVDLYQPHPHAMPQAVEVQDVVPSARLTGPLRDAAEVRAGLQTLLGGHVRFLEVGVRGFLRSAEGQTEWMPWRRNVVLPRSGVERVAFEEGVKYVLE